LGVKQLHSVDIAHQDLKPSNVVVFENLISKLADLGRSAHPDFHPPHDDLVIPGGIPYAPPELRYRFTHPDFNQRRFGADAFLLGNIILFSFTRLTMSTVIFSFLSPQHMPFTWAGTYPEVLPYLQSAFNDALVSVESDIPEEVRSDVLLMLRQLCEPDLAKRGHPLNRFHNENSFSLERYITELDLLAYKAERNLL
jgi:serine/threonine protein kinase